MRRSENPPAGGLRIYAEPNLVEASPFLPATSQKARYPLALLGFSAIDLRDHQQWVAGKDEHQALFDGQLYRFSDARQRAIFAAAPQRYAPALGGDCLVTFAETGDRAVGDLHYGLQHGQRLFFFAGSEQRERFRENPMRFVDADLAHQGNCVVSKIDRQQRVQGLPETVVTVGGLRYLFLGTQQQTQFLADLERYGAEIVVASNDLASSQEMTSAKIRDKKMSAGSSSKGGKETVASPGRRLAGAKVALAGYCPVSIRDNGTWEEGDSRLQMSYDGKVYQFAGETEKALFTKNPTVYLPALAGDCIVSLVKSNMQVPGSIFHSVTYQGQLFLFAGAEQRLAFKDDPESYTKSSGIEEKSASSEQATR
ncbi:MAG: hypothetical protein GXP28_11250 [Planctomycetes bacterium]|nr:hypothetical protein [Planctomycetota bacterium]